jgi:uncharacterized membrane protein YeaQ/YmgE (transglycosylase-associated protein family)
MTASGVFSAILIGAVIGIFARLVLPGRQRISVLMIVIIGIAAALLGTWLAQQVGVKTTSGIDWIELIFQIGLAAIGIALISGAGRGGGWGTRGGRGTRSGSRWRRGGIP